MTTFTRTQYMNKECTHDEYYSQFVTELTLSFVRNRIGIPKLLESNDVHLNDIGIKHSNGGAGSWIWDHSPINGALLRELGGVSAGCMPSPATYTCIGKAAARMLIAQEVAS